MTTLKPPLPPSLSPPSPQVNFCEFESQKHGIDVLYASCHMPLLGGMSPVYIGGVGYFDGTLSATFPSVGSTPMVKGLSYETIRVASFRDGVDVCPGVYIPPLWMAAPPPMEVMMKLTDLGYLRAAAFFFAPENSAHFILKLRRDAQQYDVSKIAALIAKVVRYLEAYQSTWRVPNDDCSFAHEDLLA